MKFREVLQEQHYVEIQFPLSADELREGAQSFLEFLSVPKEVLYTLHFPHTETNATADGFVDKRGRDGEGKDSKCFFHYLPSIEAYPASRAAAAKYPAVRNFFAAARHIHKAAEQVAVETICTHFPTAVTDQCIVNGRLARAPLRFLAYENRPGANFAAIGHKDNGIASMPLAESSPGLRIRNARHEMVPVRHATGTCFFMPGVLMPDYDPAIPGAWHDVVHLPDEPPVNENYARWAIVLFVNHKEKLYKSWEEAHAKV